MELLPLAPNVLMGRKHQQLSDPQACLRGDGGAKSSVRCEEDGPAQKCCLGLHVGSGTADSVALFSSTVPRVSRPGGSASPLLRVDVPHALFIPDSPVCESKRHRFYVQLARAYGLPRWALKQRKRPVPLGTTWEAHSTRLMTHEVQCLAENISVWLIQGVWDANCCYCLCTWFWHWHGSWIRGISSPCGQSISNQALGGSKAKEYRGSVWGHRLMRSGRPCFRRLFCQFAVLPPRLMKTTVEEEKVRLLAEMHSSIQEPTQ